MAGTFIPVLSVSDHSCSKRETDEVPNPPFTYSTPTQLQTKYMFVCNWVGVEYVDGRSMCVVIAHICAVTTHSNLSEKHI